MPLVSIKTSLDIWNEHLSSSIFLRAQIRNEPPIVWRIPNDSEHKQNGQIVPKTEHQNANYPKLGAIVHSSYILFLATVPTKGVKA
ncbi:conserved hypothetical protein [Vibrio jasicida]|nr:conserved hypothetical protein [Vibrio jasicida]